ncbi:LysR family transcriptional regulator [Fulvivirga sediminis]|uniref:LysR family transcriptional regulator n=1 Tax=Fulvivirga sediminis TaxID=2803949 RepID=A0A937K317_9BACT|nr:LysR family transcriptional regulator [Fulvivirga sediminis]MBL3658945.1 LysR family transcriptional regulator [Fulvivirga sediminis]
MIDLEWLRTFISIYENANLTEAAKQLNMTQPGVSKHLQALENHIGKTLFDRTTRSLKATEYGKFLYSQVNVPMHQLLKVELYSGKRSKKNRTAISIGCTSDFFNTFLVDKIYDFDMYIVTQFATEEELAEALEQEKVQLLVGVKKNERYDHIFQPMMQEELVLVCSSSIDIPEGSEKDHKKLISWLQQQVWFAYDNLQTDLLKIWEANFNDHPKVVTRYILPSYIQIVKALTKTEGVSIVPRQFCKNGLEDHDIKIPFESLETVQRSLFYAYKLKNTHSQSIEEFIKKMETAGK